jgi:hypothetical protein
VGEVREEQGLMGAGQYDVTRWCVRCKSVYDRVI